MGLELFDEITYKAENQCSEPCGFYSTEKQHSKRYISAYPSFSQPQLFL